MRTNTLLLSLVLVGFNAYADATTVSPDWAAVLLTGADYDIAGDYPNNADLIADSAGNALYASTNGPTDPGILEDGSGGRYGTFRVAVKQQFSQKLLIMMEVDASAFGSGSGFDGVADFALVADVSNSQLYVTGSDGTGCGNDSSCTPNTRPNNTNLYITAQNKADMEILDATVANVADGSDDYIEIVYNFDEMIALLQDDTDTDGDEQVVLQPFVSLAPDTPIRFSLTSRQI